MKAQPITARELRIGNLITGTYLTEGFEDDDVPKEIECSFMGCDPFNDKIWVDSNSDVDEFGAFYGIPLTPEWLERLGFNQLRSANILGSSFVFDIGRNRRISVASVEDANQMVFLQEYDPKDFRKTTDIITMWNFDYDGLISVHHLQNLVYSISRQELTIKQPETTS